ncbi:MAG: TetR/AcrR family transcriptional regulator [Geminicoccaceae bacterium]
MSRRDDLVATAVKLFRKNGYHATGVDKILSESGVSKPTLYRHFDSKDDLIVAALKKWDIDCRAWLIGAMEERGDTPRDRLLALFDVLHDWFDDSDFQGCMFINATVEFADQDNPIHLVAREHKQTFAAQIRDIVASARAKDPADVTSALMLLMEGAIVTAHIYGKNEAAKRAKAIARTILAEAQIN